MERWVVRILENILQNVAVISYYSHFLVLLFIGLWYNFFEGQVL